MRLLGNMLDYKSNLFNLRGPTVITAIIIIIIILLIPQLVSYTRLSRGMRYDEALIVHLKVCE